MPFCSAIFSILSGRMDFFSLKSILFPAPRLLSDTVAKYLSLRKDKNQLSIYISDLLSHLQNELHDSNPEIRADAVQQLVFLNSVGYDTAWANFAILEVMSIDNYSCKRIAYTAASQFWQPHSDVVLMATNRIQRDLTSNNPYYTALVLTSITPFLSVQLCQDIASDVIQQLNSSKASIRQRAAVSFYHICLHYPEALRPGFSTLKARLDDDDQSVVFAVLTVMVELCQINPRNFVGFIPKLFKMLNNCSSTWINFRLLTLLRILSTIEPRLPKKLIQPLTIVLETTPSVFVMYECVKTIIEIPIIDQNLLSAATYRLQSFLNVPDSNLRFLCLSLFLKLMKIQPHIVSQHRDLISMCLDSDNELERMMALDLMSNLVTPKTIDSIVGKMFSYFQESNFIPFRDGMIEKVVDMCTRGGNYEMIQDFDWYISVLMDFVENDNFTESTSGILLAQQFTELAYRVPDVRTRLVNEMGNVLDLRSCTPLMMSACHIISEFSENSEMFSKVLQPIIAECDDRVHVSCLTTSFNLYLKCKTDEELTQIEQLFEFKLPLFLQSRHIEVQEIAASLIELINVCKTLRSKDQFELFRSSFSELTIKDDENETIIEVPDELNEPLTIFDDSDEELDVLYPYIKKKRHHRRHHKTDANDENQQRHRRKSKKQENIFGDDDDHEEEKIENETNEENNEDDIKHDAFVERMIRRKQSRRKKSTNKKPEELPVSGPTIQSRIQLLGKNSSISVRAMDFIPAQKNLEIIIEITNLSPSDIPSVDFSVIETSTIHQIKAESIFSVIQGSLTPNSEQYQNLAKSQIATVQHSITVSVEDTLIPQLIKFYVLPVSGEALEARLRIFPSFFLTPVDPALFEIAQTKVGFKKSTEIHVPEGIKPRDVLQTVANVLQASVVDSQVDQKVENQPSNEGSNDQSANESLSQPNEVRKKALISKTSTGEYVVITLTYKDDNTVLFEIDTPIEKLSMSLIKEVELKMKASFQ